MPVTTSIHPEDGYIIARYAGPFSDAELLSSYADVHRQEDKSPERDTLVDLREAALAEITGDGIRRLQQEIEKDLKQRSISSRKVAICAPRDLEFGFARMYSILAEEAPEHVRVFRDLQEAEAWLTEL